MSTREAAPPTTPPTALQTSLEFTYTVRVGRPQDVGTVRGGRRLVYDVLGGEVHGERIRGEILPGGGDWMLLSPDGWGRLDVRAQLRLHDGALVYLSYDGVLQMTDAIKQAPDGADTAFEDQYFRCSPRLETGAPAHRWVNHTLFVSKGRVTPGPGLEYHVYRVH